MDDSAGVDLRLVRRDGDVRDTITQRGDVKELLQLCGGIVAVVIVLLPALGYVSRYVAFWPLGAQSAEVASAAPITILALGGFIECIPVFVNAVGIRLAFSAIGKKRRLDRLLSRSQSLALELRKLDDGLLDEYQAITSRIERAQGPASALSAREKAVLDTVHACLAQLEELKAINNTLNAELPIQESQRAGRLYALADKGWFAPVVLALVCASALTRNNLDG